MSYDLLDEDFIVAFFGGKRYEGRSGVVGCVVREKSFKVRFIIFVGVFTQGILEKCVKNPQVPLEGFVEDDIFKLYYSDVGVLNNILKMGLCESKNNGFERTLQKLKSRNPNHDDKNEESG